MLPFAMAPRISIVICTFNRSRLLAQCLSGIAKQTAGREAFETLVVDNGSTDETPQVAADGRDTLGLNLRYFYMPTPAANAARNFGIEQAQCDCVAFLDDDAAPHPGWAAAVIDAFDTHPNAGAVGGPIRLRFDAPPPPWLEPSDRHLLCEIDYGPETVFIGEGDNQLFNANMAVRRSFLPPGGAFHPALDRFGEALLSGGEVDLQQRLRQCGREVVYAPLAAVDHCIPAARLTDEYFSRRWYWQGATEARMLRLRNGLAPRLAGIVKALYSWARTLAAIIAYRVSRRPNRSRALRHFLHWHHGFLREILRPHRFPGAG